MRQVGNWRLGTWAGRHGCLPACLQLQLLQLLHTENTLGRFSSRPALAPTS